MRKTIALSLKTIFLLLILVNVGLVTGETTAKPEFEIDISKYFQTSYLDLDEEAWNRFNQFAVITKLCDETINSPDWLRYFVVPVKYLIGEEKSLLNFRRISAEVLSKDPLIQEAFKYRKQHGKIDETKTPEWLLEKLQMVSKKFAFKMMAMFDNHDYGLDIDYLSIPAIDNGKLQLEEGKERVELLYRGVFVFQETYKYDQLLNEYSGVATSRSFIKFYCNYLKLWYL